MLEQDFDELGDVGREKTKKMWIISKIFKPKMTF